MAETQRLYGKRLRHTIMNPSPISKSARKFSTARIACVFLPLPNASMTPSDFREVLHLLDSALSLFERRRSEDPARLQRELRAVSLKLDLLRVRLGQPAAMSQRN